MKRSSRSVKLRLNRRQRQVLEELHATGLYGATLEEAALRILDEHLQEAFGRLTVRQEERKK